MIEIKPIAQKTAENVLEMMRVFYVSEAVFTNGSEEIFRRNVELCVIGDPYIEGYVFEENGTVLGYAMAAKSYSTEFGKHCIWIEDLYLKPEFCNKGIGSEFLRFIEKKYPEHLLRLEVETENERAVHVYRKNGFEVLPYTEMKK